jgi:hypothetical protein
MQVTGRVVTLQGSLVARRHTAQGQTMSAPSVLIKLC